LLVLSLSQINQSINQSILKELHAFFSILVPFSSHG